MSLRELTGRTWLRDSLVTSQRRDSESTSLPCLAAAGLRRLDRSWPLPVKRAKYVRIQLGQLHAVWNNAHRSQARQAAPAALNGLLGARNERDLAAQSALAPLPSQPARRGVWILTRSLTCP
jgi:hypothetical protein